MSLNLEELTQKIIGTYFHVYNTLGAGFMEKVYENALAHELRQRGHQIIQQAPLTVWYQDIIVGEYFADIVVDGRVILELKAVRAITDLHKAQLVNYLRATDIEVGLILNFGPEAKFVRQLLTNDRKPIRQTSTGSRPQSL